jgi:nucleoside-diphosphate-sugar epimerase
MGTMSRMSHRILIAGCGYMGTALGERLVAGGHEVWGLRRDPSGLPASFNKIAADLAQRASLDSLPQGVDTLVYCASAGEASDSAYQRAYVAGLEHVLDALRGHALRRVFFTSSTAVYAQSDGAWVDETSETRPVHFSGRRTLEAENVLRSSGVPATVLRCAGIYGPGRTRLIDTVRQGTASMSARFTNRIHRDDIAGAVVHLMERDLDPPLLLLADDEPAPQRDVTLFLAAELGVAPPQPGAADPAGRGGDKRCKNALLKSTGYALRYPTYRDGYRAMLRAGN